MTQRMLIAVLGVLFVMTLIGHALVGRDPTRPNVQFLPEMVHSPAYRSYSPNPIFADGKTMQNPVAETLPRGHERFPYQATVADAERAGRELVNPLVPSKDRPPTPRDTEIALRGRDRYVNYCQVCHGSEGKGDGPMAARGIIPPSFLADRALQMKDGQMYHILMRGQANMPSFAAQLTAEERWSVILYVRQLQQAGTPKGGKP